MSAAANAGLALARPREAQTGRLHPVLGLHAADGGADRGAIAGGEEVEQITAGQRGGAAADEPFRGADREGDAQRGVDLDQQVGSGESEGEEAVALVLDAPVLGERIPRRQPCRRQWLRLGRRCDRHAITTMSCARCYGSLCRRDLATS
jgi:hypothetical protein